GSAEPRTKNLLDFSLTSATTANGEVTITVRASGSGAHKFSIRAENLTIDRPEESVVLRAGRPGVIRWKARIQAANAPWLAVVIPDDDVARRREVLYSRH
ncbi:MAG TPA: hypothetical protein VJB15_06170, partial [Rhodothermia bacterium]|nr:hypothetical protein [Rhodothermia bacterium]